MTKIQQNIMRIEKIQNPEQKIKIQDNINGDIFIISRGDIKRFGYSECSKNAYIDFVLPFVDGKEIRYNTYSRRNPIVKSGEILFGFCIDKDVDISLVKNTEQT